MWSLLCILGSRSIADKVALQKGLSRRSSDPPATLVVACLGIRKRLVEASDEVARQPSSEGGSKKVSL